MEAKANHSLPESYWGEKGFLKASVIWIPINKFPEDHATKPLNGQTILPAPAEAGPPLVPGRKAPLCPRPGSLDSCTPQSRQA